MTRRIIYILLAVVVVLAVVLGIRWWLNRDTGEDTVAEESVGLVEDMAAENPLEEPAPEGDTGEAAPVEEGAMPEETTGETAVTDITGRIRLSPGQPPAATASPSTAMAA